MGIYYAILYISVRLTFLKTNLVMSTYCKSTNFFSLAFKISAILFQPPFLASSFTIYYSVSLFSLYMSSLLQLMNIFLFRILFF